MMNSRCHFVDLGFCEDEPIDFAYDTSINKPILCQRVDNFYYAYPTINGWVFYRSRYVDDERDKDIVKISFMEWANKVIEECKQSV